MATPRPMDQNQDYSPDPTVAIKTRFDHDRAAPERHGAVQRTRQPLRLTPYGDGLAEIRFSDPISGKFNLPEMGFPTP